MHGRAPASPSSSAPSTAPRRKQNKPRNRGRAGRGGSAGGGLGTKPFDTGLRARLRYRFDQTIAGGTTGVIAWLGLVTIAIILVAATIAVAIGHFATSREDTSWLESVWQTMLRIVDAGTFAGDNPWPVRLLGFAVTLAGIFIAGSLIGLIANAVDRKVDELAKGRGQVIESGHTLVLGWNGQVFTLVSELAVANENQDRPAIVFLVEDEKSDVETALHERVPELRGTRLVVRSGDRTNPEDLRRVGIETARSVIVLRDDHGDPGVVTCLLAVHATGGDPERPVVAELGDRDIAASVRHLIDGVVSVNPDVAIAEVTAQACRQSGLSLVFKELLDFDGDEIYVTEIPQLVGRTYGFAQQCFDRSTVIGRQRADGTVELNPAPSDRFEPGDRVVAITADDDTTVFAAPQDAVDVDASALLVPRDETPLRILIMGWSAIGHVVLRELDQFVAPGTHIDLVVDPDVAPPPDEGDLVATNASVAVRAIPRSSITVPAETAAIGYDQLIVLGYRDHLDREDADSRTLLTLLALRRTFGSGPRVVGQILDPASVDLAGTTGVDDLVVSDNLGVLLIAQLSENPALEQVFEELFDPSGAFVTMAPAGAYTGGSTPVRFNDVVRAASRLGQTAIGYRRAASGEVVLNPPKHDIAPLADADQVVVIAGRA